MNLKLLALVLCVLPAGITRCAFAADPTCFPGEPTADARDAHLYRDSNGCAAVWYCDESNQWVRYGFYGNIAECQSFVAVNSFASLTRLTHDQKVSLWRTLTLDDPADAAVRPLVDLAPTPKSIPPSGLIVRDKNAYRITSPTNAAPVFQLSGSVPIGTACDVSQKLGPYYRVDRTKVVIPKGALLAPAYYASCDP